jgi:hypothetical protein
LDEKYQFIQPLAKVLFLSKIVELHIILFYSQIF